LNPVVRKSFRRLVRVWWGRCVNDTTATRKS